MVGAGGALAFQYLADQLTLSWHGGDTLSPPSTTSPPGISDLATALKSKVKISQNFVAFPECMNFNFVHCFICQHYVSIKVFLTLEKTKERMRRTLFQVLFPLLSFSVHNGIKKFWTGFWSLWIHYFLYVPKHFCTLWNS